MFTCHEHMWQIFKDLDADCRRLPRRNGLPEQAPVTKTPAVVAPNDQAEPEARPVKKKPRRQPVPAAVIEEPAVDLYDYPFVERVVEEPAEPIELETEPSEFHEYSFDLPAVEYRVERQDEGNALAYIVGAGAELTRHGGKPRVAG
jgi:hypothetical protein